MEKNYLMRPCEIDTTTVSIFFQNLIKSFYIFTLTCGCYGKIGLLTVLERFTCISTRLFCIWRNWWITNRLLVQCLPGMSRSLPQTASLIALLWWGNAPVRRASPSGSTSVCYSPIITPLSIIPPTNRMTDSGNLSFIKHLRVLQDSQDPDAALE